MPDRVYYAEYELRIIMLELRALELRYNHNHDEKGRFTFSSGGAIKQKNSSLKNTNYSKGIGIFNDAYISSESKIKAKDIEDDLKTTKIGREISNYAENLKEPILLDDKTLKLDCNGLKIYGEDDGDKIIVYLRNCENAERAARTVIHECTHRRYGIGQSQWAEAVCFAQELKHKYKRDTLTIAEKRRIIIAVKNGYPEYKWRKGGRIYGRQQDHVRKASER